MEHGASLTASAAEMVAGHVTLDISCIDRLYLNGYVQKLQTPGGVIYFFHEHRKKPVVSPSLFEPIGAKFRKDMKDWAQAGGVPVISFKAGERKAEPQFSFAKEQCRVSVFYVYIWDTDRLVRWARERPGLRGRDGRRCQVFCQSSPAWP